MVPSSFPNTLGGLRRAVAAGQSSHRTVKDEVRANLIARLRSGGPLFPGVVGYDDTVIPQLVNAILSRHNFILLVFAARRRRVSSAVWSRCSTNTSRSSPGAS